MRKQRTSSAPPLDLTAVRFRFSNQSGTALEVVFYPERQRAEMFSYWPSGELVSHWAGSLDRWIELAKEARSNAE